MSSVYDSLKGGYTASFAGGVIEAPVPLIRVFGPDEKPCVWSRLGTGAVSGAQISGGEGGSKGKEAAPLEGRVSALAQAQMAVDAALFMLASVDDVIGQHHWAVPAERSSLKEIREPMEKDSTEKSEIFRTSILMLANTDLNEAVKIVIKFLPENEPIREHLLEMLLRP